MKKDYNNIKLESFEKELAKYKNYIQKMAMSYGEFGNAIFQDLIQVGIIGFWMAYTRWETGHNVDLTGYAKAYIRGHQLRYLQSYSKTIRLAAPFYRKVYKGLETCVTDTVSLNTKLNSEFSDSLKIIDIVDENQSEPETEYSFKDFEDAINEAVKDPKNNDMIRMYFGLHPYLRDYKAYEIAEKYELNVIKTKNLMTKLILALKRSVKLKQINGKF